MKINENYASNQTQLLVWTISKILWLTSFFQYSIEYIRGKSLCNKKIIYKNSAIDFLSKLIY